MLAECMQCWDFEGMGVSITIRDVPQAVRNELASRAAAQGKSMQEYLRAELERLASKPSIQQLLQEIRVRKRASASYLTTEQILRDKDADRK